MSPALSSFARMSQPVNRTRAAASCARALSTRAPQRTRQTSRAAAVSRLVPTSPRLHDGTWPATAWARHCQPCPSRYRRFSCSTKMLLDESQPPANGRGQVQEIMTSVDLPALERELDDSWVDHDLKETDKLLRDERFKPDAPWGLAVYRTCYDDKAKWQKMREHLETLVEASDESNPRVAAVLRRHRFVIMDDRAQFDGASPAKVRDHFEQWSKEELERNWAQQPVTDEMRTYMYGGPGGLKYDLVEDSGTQYNVFMVIDDISLMSLDKTRPRPMVMLVKRDYAPSPPKEEGDEVHPDYEDGWMYDHDEGPNGWIYIDSIDYPQHYDILNYIYDWSEDFMYMYPSYVYGDMGLKRSPAFWRDEVAAEKAKLDSRTDS